MKDNPPKTTLQPVLSSETLKHKQLLKGGDIAAQTKKQDLDRITRKHLKEKLKKKRERSTKTITWLEKRFPNCFNLITPKPLKIKIEDDLYRALGGDGSLSRIRIRQALGFYTTRLSYHESFLTNNVRFDLNGNAVEPIEKAHRDFAKIRIEERNEA